MPTLIIASSIIGTVFFVFILTAFIKIWHKSYQDRIARDIEEYSDWKQMEMNFGKKKRN